MVKFPKYSVPAYPGVEIFKSQLFVCPDAESTDVLGEVFSTTGSNTTPLSFAIKNVSNMDWKCITSTGNARILKPNEIMPAKPGIKVSIGNGTFEITN